MTRFDEETMRRLEQLALVADRVRVGVMKGDRRSRKRGTSIEFADYRDYVPGDDLRRLDWNVLARLERPFIKLLEEEEDLAVHLLVDSSGSMEWPADAAQNKLAYAVRLAAALGYVALAGGDRLSVMTLASAGDRRWGPFRGRGHALRLFEFLDQTGGAGVTDLNQSLRAYALRAARPGLLFLLSDLLSPNGYEEGLDALLGRGYEVVLVHILSPDEVDPPLAGDVKLVDVETQGAAEITLDANTRRLYRERLTAWQRDIAARAAARRGHYVPVVTDMPWDRLVQRTLRERGVVR